MKKHALIVITLIFATFISCNKKEVSYSQQMISSHGLGDFYCNRNHKDSLENTSWDYVSGLIASSVLRAWEIYPEKEEYYNAVKTYADNSLKNGGKEIIKVAKNKPALGESNLDDLAAGKIFFDLYKEELKKGNEKDAEKYKTAATLIRNKLKYNHERINSPLPGAGGFFHKAKYPNQMWLDGLFMGPTVYAQWQGIFGKDSVSSNEECWSDIANQFEILHKYTYDSIKQLNYHAWSATPEDPNSFWANKAAPHKGCSKEFWGRSMGWYFGALVDVLEWMPKDNPDYPKMVKICNDVADGLKRWQDKNSHLWYQLLQYDSTMTADGKGDEINGQIYNKGTNPNYLESSCSCIFTYAYFKGIRLGILDKDEYLPVALNAYKGILKKFIVKNGDKIDIIQSCASAGLGPAKDHSRTGTINYYLCGKDVSITKNEGKAIGSFIFASLEYELYKSKVKK